MDFVFSAYDYVIPASGKIVASTDLQIALPGGCYGRIGKNFLHVEIFFIVSIIDSFLPPPGGIAICHVCYCVYACAR